MKKGDILFHRTLHFGIVKEVEGKYYTFEFLEFGEKVLSEDYINDDKDMIFLFSKSFIEHIKSPDVIDDFNLTTQERGMDYYKNNMVRSFSLIKNNLFSTVSGTKTFYKVLILHDESFTCNCPVMYNCKHQAATILKLKEIIAKLEKYVDSISSIEINNINYKDLLDFKKDEYIGNLPFFGFKRIKNIISNFNPDEYYNLLKFISDNYQDYRTFWSGIIFLTTTSDKINELYQVVNFKVYRNLGKFNEFFEKLEDIDQLVRIDKYKYCIDVYLYYYLKDDYTKLFEIYLEVSKFPLILINIVINNLDDALLNSKFDIYLPQLINKSKDEINLLINKLTFENKSKLFLKMPEFISNDENLNAFNDLDKIALLASLDIKFSYNYLKNNFNKFKNQSDLIVTLVQSICKLIKRCTNLNDKTKFINLLNQLPNTSYLANYYLYYDYNKKYNEERINEECLNDSLLSKPSYMRINYDNLFRYNELLVSVNKVNNKLETTIEVFNNENILVKVKKIDDNFTILLNYIEGVKYLSSYLYDYVIENNIDNIKEKIEDIKNQIDQDVILQEDFKFQDALNEFASAISLYETANTKKANMEVELSDNNGNYNIDFKIGYDQLYKVKSLDFLLDGFKKNMTYKYGKKFIFTHNLCNLNSPYDKLFNYLLELDSIAYNSYYNSSILLKDVHVSHILEILNNTNITYNNILYYLDLIELELTYSINNDYVLKMLVDNKIVIDKNIKKIGNDLYYFNNEQHIINKINAKDKDILLYDMLNQFVNKSIKRNYVKFKDIIYPRFQDKIELDSVLFNEFMASKVEINAYFDYISNTICVDTHYLLNGIEVRELKTDFDIKRNEIYQNYLRSLGFIDFKITEQTKILEFFKLDFSYLKSLCKVYLSDSILNMSVSPLEAPTIRIQYENNMVDAFLEGSIYDEDELKEIFKSLKRKKKYAILHNNKIIDLDNAQSEEFLEAIEDFNISEKNPTEVITIPTYQALKAYAHLNNCKIDDYLSKMSEDIKNYKNYEVELPSLKATLRDYQIEGYKWLKVLKNYHMGGILADDMGLGKTLQIISLISSSKENLPSLIVCPKSLVFNWKFEFTKFSYETKVYEIYGSQVNRREIINNIKLDEKAIYIISYDSLSRDLTYLNQEFNFLILDEAQTIKNVKAHKTENVKQVKANYRYALTGTPIENNVIDLWSIFDFLMPKYFEDVREFKFKYENDPEYINKIALKVAPFILRRTKKDVLKDLPSKFERIITCEMSPEQRKIYDAYCNEAKEKLESDGTFATLAYLTRLRQICVEPNLFIESDVKGAKMELLNNLIDENINEHKILIFSQFVKALNIIEENLNSKNISYYKITGDTDAIERLKLTNKFNNDNTKIFLISLKAGGTGLNLVGADMVIHIDPWWNISAENQATDRAYRIGQTKNVEVLKLICEDTIEQRVIELQNYKKDIIDKVISDDDTRLKNISVEDLQFILD